ncbi:hypothetical protein Q1695_004807 [Nippostrongylus brasiliensis]|nr:hypothetical protein Q1695_004807 [Nippostrongylus brasiliensis]
MVTEVCREYHLHLVLTFVDYEKAFDSVETNAILSARIDQGEDSSYMRMLADCYHRYRRGVAKHGSKGSWRHEQAVTPTGGDNERCDLGELVSKERFAFLYGV